MHAGLMNKGLPAASAGSASTPEDRQACISQEIEALLALDLDALRLCWRKATGRMAPADLPKFLLLRMLAYRMQAAVFGDLHPETLQALRRMARRNKRSGPDDGRRRPAAGRILKPGTVLLREWEGSLHRVTVLSDGFAWNEKTYASLSTVAKAITGTQWSGPRFFGLPGRRIVPLALKSNEPTDGTS
jgi:hypothetical protein